MKTKCNLPWFVLENRADRGKVTDVMRERRAIVMCVVFMVLVGGLLALSAAYCRPVLVAMVAVGFIIGMATMVRTVFYYCKGD